TEKLAVQAAAPRPAGGARLLLGEPGDATQLFQADIIFLERRVRTTWVHTLQGQAATGEKLESLLARLAPDAFCQTHKSFAVHWPMVEQYGKTLIRLSGGVQVPISRRYAARVRQSFLRYVTALQGGPAADGEAPP
ncbi:LytTR family DNA-binding domain-containing protein, partial [uncultured Subdoligranulum sp.]|uniref:LytTR family DNA-binding domain-containing protein n=1 Tax=uncultured Subdoligranulum sp. TaxID=512298 RepID=UPI002621079C